MRKDVVNRSQNWRGLTPGAKLLISLVVAAGTGVLLYGAIHPTSKNIAQFICYLLIAILASRLKVNLPGITGTMSVNFLFILLGILERRSSSAPPPSWCSVFIVTAPARFR